MLDLVLADGHGHGLVEEDVGRLQDRVGEEPRVDVLLGLGALRLLLELGHPGEVAHRGDGVEDPGQLGVLRHVRLDEELAARRVETRGHVDEGGVERALREQIAIVWLGQRVIVDDAEDRLVGVQQPDPVADRPAVVADVDLAARLDAAEQIRLHASDLLQSHSWRQNADELESRKAAAMESKGIAGSGRLLVNARTRLDGFDFA